MKSRGKTIQQRRKLSSNNRTTSTDWKKREKNINEGNMQGIKNDNLIGLTNKAVRKREKD